MYKDLIVKDISQIDIKHAFFHYTNKQNLDIILKNGLEPRIGESSYMLKKHLKYSLLKVKKVL